MYKNSNLMYSPEREHTVFVFLGFGDLIQTEWSFPAVPICLKFSFLIADYNSVLCMYHLLTTQSSNDGLQDSLKFLVVIKKAAMILDRQVCLYHRIYSSLGML